MRVTEERSISQGLFRGSKQAEGKVVPLQSGQSAGSFAELMQGTKEAGCTRDEPMTEIDQTQISLQNSGQNRARKVANSAGFLWKGRNAQWANQMTEEEDELLSKLIFFQVDDEVMGSEPVKDCPEVLEVLVSAGTSNEDVINIDASKG